MTELREPWFETYSSYYKSPLRPISREGRRALLILSLGMASVIPLALLIGFSGIGPDAAVPLVLASCAICLIGVPAWFFWIVRGRIRVLR